MKVRSGFVSNSSSASFVIQKSALTEEQINKIRHHVEFADASGLVYPNDIVQSTYETQWKEVKAYDDKNGPPPCCWPEEWNISETETTISGDTGMTNFDMFRFLELIGVPSSAIDYHDES